MHILHIIYSSLYWECLWIEIQFITSSLLYKLTVNMSLVFILYPLPQLCPSPSGMCTSMAMLLNHYAHLSIISSSRLLHLNPQPLGHCLPDHSVFCMLRLCWTNIRYLFKSLLWEVFVNGLCEPLKVKLASQNEPANLDSLVSLAVKLDDRLHE